MKQLQWLSQSLLEATRTIGCVGNGKKVLSVEESITTVLAIYSRVNPRATVGEFARYLKGKR